MREQFSDLAAEDGPKRKVARVAATSEASTSCESDHPPGYENVTECPERKTQLEISSTDAPEFRTVNDVNTVEECGNCMVLKETNRQLLNRVKTLTGALGKRREERKNEQRKHRSKGQHQQECRQTTDFAQGEEFSDKEGGSDSEVESVVEDDDGTVEVELEDDKSVYNTETETETETGTETDEESGDRSTRLSHIVFLSQLLLLFQFCHTCKADNPTVETSEIGTEAVVRTTCNNPKCQKQNTWYSQPLMPGYRIPAGNFLLCLCILLTGGSATKVFQMFNHMGLGCVSLTTFFNYQSKLFPTIHLYWQNYQKQRLTKLKTLSNGVTIAGDGRHDMDSMGHSAKLCAYTMFCCTVPMIIHFALVQRNDAGSSPAMEFMAFKKCMDFLLAYGLVITTFISDRHVSIASHMKKVLNKIVHYFDIWDLKKKIRKVLSKVSKEKGCEALGEWIKPCENHLQWSATSTFSGNGRIIWAKFKAFLSHVVNKHAGLEDPLFNKCSHGDIQPRKWLRVDYVKEIYQTFVNASKDELNEAAKKLKDLTPAPMNTMLDRQPREQALQKRDERNKMVTRDVPPTTPGILRCCFE
ncbi:uncharacterized protein [Montipora foliosa]|uniref:uncharacterized protein n=1 Tax=Montipora foliosa TaxID=591990 RepID=UPI0035F15176